MIVATLLMFSCKISMRELRTLRVYSEELERLLEFANFEDTMYQNRSRYVINEMLETLWECT